MEQNIQMNETKSAGRFVRVVVVSNKMQKTCVGLTTRLVKEPNSGKYIKKSTRIKFHDEAGVCNQGDEVLIQECRPLSAHKSFTLSRIVTKSKG